MKFECYTIDISSAYESSLPKFFAYLDWHSFISAPVRKSVRVEGVRGFRTEFQDSVYHHYLMIDFGIGKHGVHIEIKYKPFRYIPKQVMVYSDILKREREKTEYSRKYL